MTNFQRGPYRIGIDARFYRSSTAGIGRYTRELIQALASQDQQNEYFVYITPDDQPEWLCDNPNFQPVVVPIPHYSLAEQTKFAKQLYQDRLDLVHFLHFNHPILYAKPFVVTLHDLTLLHFPEGAGKSSKSLFRQLAFKTVFKSALKRAKKVIAVSEYTAKDAEKTFGISHAKMEVIYHGVRPRQTLPFGSKKLVQDYLGMKDPYILFLSQWRQHKGLKTLLEAFTFLKEKGYPHKLVLLGRQDAAPLEIRSVLAEHPFTGEIVTPGFAPEELLPAILSYASAFVMPSEYEGFGLPVVEALSYGVPTIVANNSSLPEVGGRAVLYFPTGDAKGLVAGLEELITDSKLVEKLQTEAAKHLAQFNWQRTAEKTLSVYQSVLERRR